jgi:hypothetical protein
MLDVRWNTAVATPGWVTYNVAPAHHSAQQRMFKHCIIACSTSARHCCAATGLLEFMPHAGFISKSQVTEGTALCLRHTHHMIMQGMVRLWPLQTCLDDAERFLARDEGKSGVLHMSHTHSTT